MFSINKFLICAIGFSACLIVGNAAVPILPSGDEVELLKNSLSKFNMTDKLNPSELVKLLPNFRKQLAKVKELSKKLGSTKFGITSIALLSPEDREQMYMKKDAVKKRQQKFHKGTYKPHLRDPNIPLTPRQKIEKRATSGSSIDLRNYNMVTSVKKQGKCGCCFIFSSIAALEGAYSAAKGTLYDFSEQLLLDCVYDDTSDDDGCDGGDERDVYDFAKTKGILRETSYVVPGKANYTGVDGTCKMSTQTGTKYKPTHNYIEFETEEDIKDWLDAEEGSTVVMGFAFPYSFDLVDSNEIYTNEECENEDYDLDKYGDIQYHAMAIIGYGTKNGVDYWLVKNSYGTGWGDNGYVRIERGVNWCGAFNNDHDLGLPSAPVF